MSISYTCPQCKIIEADTLANLATKLESFFEYLGSSSNPTVGPITIVGDAYVCTVVFYD